MRRIGPLVVGDDVMTGLRHRSAVNAAAVAATAAVLVLYAL